jgi:hypothetical protein
MAAGTDELLEQATSTKDTEQEKTDKELTRGALEWLRSEELTAIPSGNISAKSLADEKGNPNKITQVTINTKGLTLTSEDQTKIDALNAGNEEKIKIYKKEGEIVITGDGVSMMSAFFGGGLDEQIKKQEQQQQPPLPKVKPGALAPDTPSPTGEGQKPAEKKAKGFWGRLWGGIKAFGAKIVNAFKAVGEQIADIGKRFKVAVGLGGNGGRPQDSEASVTPGAEQTTQNSSAAQPTVGQSPAVSPTETPAQQKVSPAAASTPTISNDEKKALLKLLGAGFANPPFNDEKKVALGKSIFEKTIRNNNNPQQKQGVTIA